MSPIRPVRLIPLFLMVVLVASACADDETTQTSKPSPSSGCVDFEDLTLGDVFVSGDLFTAAGVEVQVDDFVWTDGTVFSGGSAEVMSAGLAGGSGNEVFTNNVLLRFGFPSTPVEGLSFDFGAHGGNLNIEVNGDFVNFGSFADIDGATIGGVLVEVVFTGTGGIGSAKLTGLIDAFAIGGQEFAIDNICIAYPAE